jgi:hypothetical protein
LRCEQAIKNWLRFGTGPGITRYQWTQYLGGGRASFRVHKGRESTRKVCTNLSLQGVMIGSANNSISEKSPKVRRRLLLFLLNSHTVNSVKFAFLTLVFPPMLLEHAYLVAWMFSPDCRLCVSGISISALQLIANCNFLLPLLAMNIYSSVISMWPCINVSYNQALLFTFFRPLP